jgi:hypothetical protein
VTEMKLIPESQELLVHKQKAVDNFIMSLKKYATTPAHHEAIRFLLEMSREQRIRVERSIEARAARSDPRLRR